MQKLISRKNFFCLLICLSSGFVHAQPQELPSDLTEIGIKELLTFDLLVTSPGKKEQTLSNVSSAIYVLTQDDIKKSGASNIPEALRLVPGVNVARVSASQWSVSIRGFNQIFANKLLVLVDGVSAFSPLTNGVYWENLDFVMGDIERIEVIRGPGAALWGSNAVNGVVNIITKSAKATQGGEATIGAGTLGQSVNSVRYGDQIGEDTFARFSAKYSDLGGNRQAGGGDAEDLWQIGSFDARIDSDLKDNSYLTLFGHAYNQQDRVQTQTPILQPPFVDTNTYSGRGEWQGGYTSANYRKDFSETSKLNLTGSFTYQDRTSKLISLDYQVYEFEVTHQVAPLEGHDVVYGSSYRLFDNTIDGTYAQDLIPSKRSTNRVNWFVQDEITLDEYWHLVLGSKFENNSSTDFEYMPNARVIWTPNERNSVWGAVSRAVAPPSVVFEDVVFPVAAIPGENGQPDVIVETFGNRDVKSEEVLAWELGYRSEIQDNLSFDIAGFFNNYDNILTQEPEEPFFDVPNKAETPALIVPLRFRNAYNARTIGGETSLEWKPLSIWTLDFGYGYISGRAIKGASQEDEVGTLITGSAPRHTVLLRSSIEFSEDVDFGFSARYVDSLTLGDIPDYYELDANIEWRLNKSTSISFLGENLLDESHIENRGFLFGPLPTEIRRTGYVMINYKF